jgi:hypothetical protein
MVKSEDLSVSSGYENSFQGVDDISSTLVFSKKNHGFAHPSSTRKESDCMRLGLSSYTPTSVFDGLPRNISVSDGVTKNTKAECSEEGLAYYESARALHTQLPLCEGDPFMSRSPTIQADTPSPSRLKGKFL